MQKECIHCHSPFEVRSKDLEFLQRVSPIINSSLYLIPAPDACPLCREQLRMAWRNETNLFVRSCDLTRERLISMYPPNALFPVYRHREWWKDHNDATCLGIAYDPKSSVFSQMAQIQLKAPRFHVYNFQEELDVNSQYTNCAGCNKDCYLIFASGYNERCLYCRYTNHSYGCLDLFFADSCRNCYQSSDLGNCESVFFSNQCKDCHSSYFLYDCRGCHDCIGCAGLRQKSYHIFNQAYSQREYLARKQELGLDQRPAIEKLIQIHAELVLQTPHRAIHGEMNEQSIGDYLWTTKNCYQCFDSRKAEELAYCTFFCDGRDCMDIYAWGEMELCYQICGGGSYGTYHSAFTANSYGCKNCYYLDHCMFCEDCFACVGLNRKQYCILNQQYDKQAYETLLPRIINGMQQQSEWGKFLPEWLSPFGYNHSVANDYYPLSSEQALSRGFRWSNYQAEVPNGRFLKARNLGSSIENISNQILDEIFCCERSSKPYRVTKNELEFYKYNNIPLPTLHPDERQQLRLKSRNPRKLYQRTCSQCSLPLHTTYAPERPEQIYCDECYQKAIYC